MSEVIRVGMAELKVARAPGRIVTLGLGSCLGVCAYDSVQKVGGMVHIMLPDSSLAIGPTNPAKFADTGVPFLMEEMIKHGASLRSITVKIVGGAEMFNTGGSETHLAVGERNIAAVEETCRKFKIPIAAKSVGGHAGKSVTLNLDTGAVEVKSMNEVFML
ncbi:MAG: chemotaxis protein CheD [Bacillota bacterium]